MAMVAGSPYKDAKGVSRVVPLQAAPGWLAHNIRVLGRQFRAGRQEDAHEFLRRLLEHCGHSALVGAGVREGDPSLCDETTPVHAIFGGYFRNQCVWGASCVRRCV